ncbi:unnamed protein product [Linum trigynum]|uniref:Uncharacterized protein n=1 Tax=Linum trigynum TaxID=586398 RepID=A0AAV2CWJ5_9ROSI
MVVELQSCTDGHREPSRRSTPGAEAIVRWRILDSSGRSSLGAGGKIENGEIVRRRVSRVEGDGELGHQDPDGKRSLGIRCKIEPWEIVHRRVPRV